MQNITPTPGTPPPSRRSNRPPRINIHNIHNNNYFGSAMGGVSSMPPSAQPQSPYPSQTNYTGAGTAGPYWPPAANPFGATGNFMTKGYEGFLDLTKSGMSFGEKFSYGLYNKFSHWSRRWFTHIFLLIVLALYSMVGAVLFRTVEKGAADLEFKTQQYQQKLFFNELRQMARDPLFNTLPETFDPKVVFIMNAHKPIVESLLRSGLTQEEDVLKKHPWSFWNAMVYSCTVYTTIGYGHITPKTRAGRFLTIIYAIIGIPMFLIVLADLGKLFTRCVKFVWAYVRRLYYTRSCRRIRKQEQVRYAMTGINTMYDMAIRRPSMFFGMSDVPAEEESQDAEAGKSLDTSHPETPTSPYPETFEVDDEFNLPISVASMLLIAYILLGFFGYRFIEPGWSFMDSFYFIFISMSTIGFGDLVPGNPFYVMVSMIYMIFGLALTSMFINVVQIKLSDHFKRASAKVGATIGMNMASEFGDELGSQAKTISELASVHGSRLGPIDEDIQEGKSPQPHLTSILRPPRPLSPTSMTGEPTAIPRESPPPLLPKRQPDPRQPTPTESESKKKYRFF